MRSVVLAGLLLVLAHPLSAADKEDPAKVFGFTNVWQLHLNLSAKEFAALEPAGIGFPGFGGPGGPPKAPAKPTDRDVPKGGSFGIEYPWAHAELAAEGKTYKDVGLRYKGGGSYVMSNGKLRRNFKVD